MPVRDPAPELRALADKASAILEALRRSSGWEGTGKEFARDRRADVEDLVDDDILSPLAGEWAEGWLGEKFRSPRRAAESQARAWISRIMQRVEQISVDDGSLKREGNSRKLKSRFTKAMQAARFEARVDGVARTLETLAVLPLVYNEDIPAYLAERQPRPWPRLLAWFRDNRTALLVATLSGLIVLLVSLLLSPLFGR